MSYVERPLFDQSTTVKISIDSGHELVRLEKAVEWDALILIAKNIRSQKVIKESGPQPHYRELLGAMTLMAIRKLTFREAEDLIYHYGPAKYLCNLMDSDWRIDHVTIFEFTQMLGQSGIEKINTQILKSAVGLGLADPSEIMSDTTAQEARIPYPNEVGLMSRYSDLLTKNLRKLGGKFRKIKAFVKEKSKKIKALARNSHLFAKTKEEKRKVGKKMYHITKEVHSKITDLLATGRSLPSKAGKEVERLSEVMKDLLPQMLHFIETGFVASKKIIHLQMTDLYSIVRGKAGKKVEFGLKWGISRIGGGFVQGFLIEGGKHCSDKQFCLEAVKVAKDSFGEVPEVYGFDRGGYSAANIEKLRKAGIKQVGVAPTGKTKWAVGKKMEKHIKRVRAQVEGSIGTIKSSRYGFNKPEAHSSEAMATYGQRSILGFNLMKTVREIGI